MTSERFVRPKASVLVVDDSPEMQAYLRFLLELDSYHVETASTGNEALQLLSGGYAPAVVLLDMQMPGLDGLQTLQRMRKLVPDLTVIICSGMDDADNVQQSAMLGAKAYLTKPVQHLYLSAAIERCLAQRACDASEPFGDRFLNPRPLVTFPKN
jgi:CheY-like chemotaxis protein